jgi:hypothetical protein
MTASELNELMLDAFPELRSEFELYTSWQDGLETGCFLTFEDLLLPLVRNALAKQDEPFLRRAGAFIEELLELGDEYAENIATIALLEGLEPSRNGMIRTYLGKRSLATYDNLAADVSAV